MNFASDNTSGVAPRIMQALLAANEGHVPSYGADALSLAAEAQIRRVLEAPQARVFLVSSGTAANALACAALVGGARIDGAEHGQEQGAGQGPDGPRQIFCHRTAHIRCDERDAPMLYTGNADFVLLDGADGRFTDGTLRTALADATTVPPGARRAMVSLTNVTEAGALYRPEEVAAISAVAHEAGLHVHMDGARFANAVAALRCAPADLLRGVDVLSFGGTKNGCLAVEAVVFLTPELADGFEVLMKRGGHTTSKMRFLAAQMMAYLDSDLWLRLAAQANRMATRLAQGIEAAGGRLEHPAEANEVFAWLPARTHARLRAEGAQYHFWPDDPAVPPRADTQDATPLLARLVCSWATTTPEVDRFLAILKG